MPAVTVADGSSLYYELHGDGPRTIVFAHGDKGWLFSNEGGGWEYPAFLAAAALAHGLIGDGAFALQDRLVRTFKIKALATA